MKKITTFNQAEACGAAAIIHLDHFRENVTAVRTLTGKGVCVPVKADAYGHGAPHIAKAALEAGAAHLAVAFAREGEELRRAGITAPILVLSQAVPEEVPQIAAADLQPMVSDTEFAALLGEEARRRRKTLYVHLKIDTGMGRLGCRPAEAAALAAAAAGTEGLAIAGTATHLAVSDSAAEKDIAYTRRQIELFAEAVDAIRRAGVDPGTIHAANSGGTLSYPEAWFDMVRPGILLYGYPPETPAFAPPAGPFKPVMELVSRLTAVKKMAAGDTVSYGRTWTAAADTYVGVIPCGYADGLRRALSSGSGGSPRLRVIIGGKPYPVVGRICMDQCMVDLGPAPEARRWDEVSIFGGTDPQSMNAAGLAAAAGTIPYEITCGISKRVPRVYTE